VQERGKKGRNRIFAKEECRKILEVCRQRDTEQLSKDARWRIGNRKTSGTVKGRIRDEDAQRKEPPETEFLQWRNEKKS